MTQANQETGAALDLLQDLIARARRAGADAADAVLFEGTSLSHARRLGKTEKLERSEGHDLGLRVFIGRQQAIVSSSDRSPEALSELVERAVAMARTVPEDPYCGIADPAEITDNWPSLDMLDPTEPSAEVLIERARAAEDAALAVAGVTNSEGAEAGWGRSTIALAASNGFAGTYSGSSQGVSASVIAGSGTGMERDYDFASAIYAVDLRDPAEIGKSAGERAVKRLGAQQDADLPLPGGVRPARCARLHLASAGRDLGSVDRPRHELSEGPARRPDLPRGDHDHRRPAPPARPALQAVRRRGHRQPPPRDRRQGRADDLAARSALGAPARPQDHRARRARHRLAAVAVGHQCVDRARRGQPARR